MTSSGLIYYAGNYDFYLEEKKMKQEALHHDIKHVEKEIRKTVKEPEEVAKIVKKVEEVRAEIKVEMKAEEIATRTYEKLKSEDLPISRKLKSELKKEIFIDDKRKYSCSREGKNIPSLGRNDLV